MLLIVTMGSQPHVAVLARGLVLLSRSSLGAPSMGSTRALAVALQTWWPQPLARVPLALRDLMALSCCSRALRVDGLDGLLLLKKMLDHWSEAVLRAKIQEKEDQFEQWLREDTERFLAGWRSWNRELEKAEAEEQAELEKQRAIMEFDPAHLY